MGPVKCSNKKFWTIYWPFPAIQLHEPKLFSMQGTDGLYKKLIKNNKMFKKKKILGEVAETATTPYPLGVRELILVT